jgi:excisionase family DNA binding protein
MGIIDSMAWKRRELEGYGVDIAALIASDDGTASPASNGSGGSSVSGVSDKPGEAPPSKLPVNQEQRGSAGVSETPPVTSTELSPTITAREAAKIVGIAYTTMLTELGSGRFPFANMVGNQWRISRKGLHDWLEGHRSDVEALKKQKDVVPKPRGKKAAQPRYTRPDGKPLSF